MHVTQDLLPWMEATPQPVALATGRVVRAIGAPEKLDACIKAAEVIARFVSIASLASSAATRPANVEPPQLDYFTGNLSFGAFESAVRACAFVSWDHPLREQLRSCFRKRHGVSGKRLHEFVELRNLLGHAIAPADEAHARMLLERDDPIGNLMELLDDLKDIFAYPLLVLLSQEHRRGRFLGRFIFFSGEGEPIPREIALKNPVFEWETPYLCTAEGLIPLHPGMLYKPRSSDGRLGLYLLDKIINNSLCYKSIQDSGQITRSDTVGSIGTWVKLAIVPSVIQPVYPLLEPISYADGRSLYTYLHEGGPGRSLTDAVIAAHSNGQDAVGNNSEQAIGTLHEFEDVVNRIALGSVFRDILYTFGENNSLAEVHDGGIRIMTSFDPAKTVATIEVTPARKLRVTIFAGVLTSDPDQEADSYELGPGESADEVVDRIDALFGQMNQGTE